MMVKGDDGSSIFLDGVIYYKNEQDPIFSRKHEKLMGSKMKKKKICPGRGSNSRPLDNETNALPTALPRLYNNFINIFIFY